MIGRGSGIARGIAEAARAQGAEVIAAGRSPEILTKACLTNTFMTGVTLCVDGGERLT